MMPISVKWLNDEQTIVLYEISGYWTWDDLYPEYYKAIEMEKSVQHYVDVIVDMSRSSAIPPNAISHMRSISDKQPPNIGVTVLVSNNRFIKMLLDIGTRAYGKIGLYFQIAATVEEAHEMIERAAARRDTYTPED